MEKLGSSPEHVEGEDRYKKLCYHYFRSNFEAGLTVSMDVIYYKTWQKRFFGMVYIELLSLIVYI